MRLTILGSGTSTGVPMVGCHCRVCTSSDPRDRRSRASLLVETAGRYLVVDTSTDFRQQALAAGLPRVDAVLFTHSHADHVHGIDDLRGFHFLHRQLVPCYGSAATLAAIGGMFAYIFSGQETGNYAPLLTAQPVEGPFALFGLEVLPIPLNHGDMPATGYRFGPVAYLTDCSAVPDTSWPLLAGLDTLIIDGLRHTPHPHHFTIEEAIAVGRRLGVRRTILTHLTHQVAHAEQAGLPAGVELAYDGLQLDFPAPPVQAAVENAP